MHTSFDEKKQLQKDSRVSYLYEDRINLLLWSRAQYNGTWIEYSNISLLRDSEGGTDVLVVY